MLLNRKSLLFLLPAISLFAINPVTNLTSSTHTTTTSNNPSITFSWTPPSTTPNKYYYVLDTSSSTIPVSGTYSTLTTGSSTSLTVTATASGTYYFHLQAVDSTDATSSAVHTTSAITIDIDAGTVTMSPTTGSYTETQSVTLSGSESGKVYYTLDGTTPTTSSSLYSTALSIPYTTTIKALLVDNAGNSGTVKSETYTVTNPMKVYISSGVELNSSNNTFATSSDAGATPLTALSVSGSGFTKYQYKFDSDNWSIVSSTSTNISTTSLSTGSHTLYVKGGDSNGYQSDNDAISKTIIVDNTAPSSFTETVTVGGSTVSRTSFNEDFIVGLTSNDSTATIRYTTDGTTPTVSSGNTYSSTSKIAVSASGVSSGSTSSKTIKYLAYDTAGNASSVQTSTYTIDKTKPVPAASKDAGTYTSLSVTISGTDDITSASDLKFYYTLDDSVATSVDTTNTNNLYSSALNITASKTLNYVAVDKAGNISEVKSAAYVIDSSAIDYNLTADFSNSGKFATISTYNATPKGQIKVAGSGVKYYKYKIGSDGNFSSGISVDTNVSIATLLAAGTVKEANETTIYFDVTTNSDVNTTNYQGKYYQSLTFTIDNTPPTGPSISPTTSSFTSSATVTITKPDASRNLLYVIGDSNTSYVSLTSSKVLSISETSTIKAKTSDLAGNESSLVTEVFTKSSSSSSSSAATSSGGGDTTTSGGTSSTASSTSSSSSAQSSTSSSASSQSSSSNSSDSAVTTPVTDIKDVDTGFITEKVDSVFENGVVTNTIIGKNSSGESIEISLTSKIETIQTQTQIDGTIESKFAITNTSGENTESKISVNKNLTVSNEVVIFKADGKEVKTEVNVLIVGAKTEVEADGSIKVTSEKTQANGSKIENQVTSKADGTLENKISVINSADEKVDTKLDLKIAGAKSSVKEDGSFVATTPEILSNSGKSSSATLNSSIDGKIAPKIVVKSSSNAEEEIKLPTFEAGSEVSVEEKSDGTIDIKVKNAKVPEDGYTF